MKRTFASIAAFALLSSGAALAQGQGHGNGGGGNGHGNGNGAAHAARKPGNGGGGDGHANGNGNRQMAANRGNGGAPNGNGNSAQRQMPQQVDRRPVQASKNNGNGGNGNGNENENGNANANRRDDVTFRRADRDSDYRIERYGDGDRRERFRLGSRDTGLIDGCPPGLAKKHNGCQPPGLAKKNDYGDRLRRSLYDPRWWGYRNLDGNYFYDSGYLLRYDGDRVASYIPLLGGALAIGNPWPSNYGSYGLPDYYVNYYDLGQPNGYRYADNVIYRVDPETAAITSIAALLTGDQFTVGQPMPMGYDVYNVPYAYRDQYYDRPDALYRYNNGYVYQIDPETRLIASAIELLLT